MKTIGALLTREYKIDCQKNNFWNYSLLLTNIPMKTLSSQQENDIAYYIVDMIIKNNPHLEDRDDEIYDTINEYGLLEPLSSFYEYLEENLK